MSNKNKRVYKNTKGSARSTESVIYKVPNFFQKKTSINLGVKTNDFCNAKSGSNGFDYITTYVYEKVNNGGIIEKLAYVECDYVE